MRFIVRAESRGRFRVHADISRMSLAEAVILEYNYFDNQERMIREREPLLFNEGTTLGYAQYCGAVLNGEELQALPQASETGVSE